MAFIFSSNDGDGTKRRIASIDDGSCGEDASRYGKRQRLEKPPFDSFRQLDDSGAMGAGGPPGGPRVALQEATQLTEELKKKMSNANNGVIHSEGRGQPIYAQSRIHETLAFDSFAYAKRLREQPSQMIAPLGPREAFGLQPGALLFELAGKGSGHMSNSSRPAIDSAGRGVAGFGTRLVFDCVNGLNYKEKLMFSGQGQQAVSSTDPQGDPAVASASSGTITCINTGPTTLKPNHTCMFLTTPYTVMLNGRLVPGIQEKGVHAEKFRPMLVMADGLLSPELPVRVQEEIKSAVRDHVHDGDRKKFWDAWRDVRSRVRTVVVDRDLAEQTLNDTLWIDIYIGWELLGGLGGAFTPWQESEAAAIFNELEKKHWDLANIEAYADALPLSHTPTTAPNDESEMKAHIEMRKTQALIDHRSQIAERCIGRIMTLSHPGAPVDLALGYFTA